MWQCWSVAWLAGLLPLVSCLFLGAAPDEGDVGHLYPITQIAIGFDSHTHVIPYVLGWLENIEYPKRRLRVLLYIVSKDDAAEDQISESVLPMLVNVDLIDSSYLTFDADNIPYYDGSVDPLKVFTESARRMDIELWIDNLKYYGLYIDEALELDARRRAIRYMLADLIADGLHLPIPSHTRRPERRAKMEKIFKVLGINATYWEATDGRNLSSEYPYRVLPGYLDPFHQRPIKTGEIGCFLSHYRIWEEVLKLGLRRVVVFEDDLRFANNGLERIREALEDLDTSKLDWDLIYLGRKKQADQEEVWVPYHRHLSTVGYSYWTLGYMLSAEGAHRLLDAKPLMNLLPVDEYFPIMFDKHPNKVSVSSPQFNVVFGYLIRFWADHSFFLSEPLLVYPLHKTITISQLTAHNPSSIIFHVQCCHFLYNRT
ncbi:unnamed protein product [Angiostrongylus costaricensis]|uniref:Glycosyltransferase 25 family member n=1 Tax=Angiostrongylus costaricensis TaxID=334426 RepID=A0A0R3PNA7_ANGCS|nr:unnamed protein product [Angiostrongylus costaricensis]